MLSSDMLRPVQRQSCWRCLLPALNSWQKRRRLVVLAALALLCSCCWQRRRRCVVLAALALLCSCMRNGCSGRRFRIQRRTGDRMRNVSDIADRAHRRRQSMKEFRRCRARITRSSVSVRVSLDAAADAAVKGWRVWMSGRHAGRNPAVAAALPTLRRQSSICVHIMRIRNLVISVFLRLRESREIDRWRIATAAMHHHCTRRCTSTRMCAASIFMILVKAAHSIAWPPVAMRRTDLARIARLARGIMQVLAAFIKAGAVAILKAGRKMRR